MVYVEKCCFARFSGMYLVKTFKRLYKIKAYNIIAKIELETGTNLR